MNFTYEETMQLIRAFRKHPVIYDTDAVGYNDRKTKATAWKTVAAEMSVHPEVCKRKMESLLSSCRREKSKILKGMASGRPEDVYEPHWRYWNAFKFLRGLKDEDEDPLGKAPDDAPEPKSHSPWSTARMLAHKYRKVAYPFAPVDVPKPAESRSASSADDDEFAATGIMVEAKLKKMKADQRLFAENIINQALYKGLLFQLTEKSEIRDSDFPPRLPSPPAPEPPPAPPRPADARAWDRRSQPAEDPFEVKQFPSSLVDPIGHNVARKRRRQSLSSGSGERSRDSLDDFKDMTML